jgi:hypothetical protein
MDQPRVATIGVLAGTIAVTTSWADYAAAALDATSDAADGQLRLATRAVPPQYSELSRVAEYYGLNAEPLDTSSSSRDGDPAAALIARAKAADRSAGVVVAMTEGACDIVAAYYALATGRLLVAGNESRVDRMDWPADVNSVVLVGPAERFTKAALRQLLARWQTASADFRGVGILTARTFEELSAIVCRQLAHRAFTAAGHRSRLPALNETADLRTIDPLEYYVLLGHGSETHIDHGDNDVLCVDPAWGRMSEAFWPCREASHVPARRLAAHTLLVLSCDLFTPADGLAPRANCLFYDLLAGWPNNIVAPYKHAQINNGFAILTDGLVRAGYSLGEITAVLNRIAPHGAEADPAYLLFGDPDMRILPDAANRTAPVELEPGLRDVTVFARPRGRRVIDCVIPRDGRLRLDEGAIVAPVPQSDGLTAADILVATLPNDPDGTRFLVASRSELPDETFSLRIAPVNGLAAADHADLSKRIARLGFLESLGVAPRVVSELRQRLLAPMRNAASYPRALDLMLGAAVAHYLLPLLAEELAAIRRAALTELCALIATERSWFSHRYRAVFPIQQRIAVVESESQCAECGNAIARWRSDDPAGEAEPRTRDICERCGLIADRPLDFPAIVAFDVHGGITGPVHRHTFSVANTSDRAISFSLAAQFNEWASLGIEADPQIVDMELPAGATESVAINLTFNKTHPIDLISLHCYVMTDRCDVAAFTRRAVIDARSLSPEA